MNMQLLLLIGLVLIVLVDVLYTMSVLNRQDRMLHRNRELMDDMLTLAHESIVDRNKVSELCMVYSNLLSESLHLYKDILDALPEEAADELRNKLVKFSLDMDAKIHAAHVEIHAKAPTLDEGSAEWSKNSNPD